MTSVLVVVWIICAVGADSINCTSVISNTHDQCEAMLTFMIATRTIEFGPGYHGECQARQINRPVLGGEE